ncbi:MAG: cytochrome c-type biogenesis protein CcmH [Chloroflexi bacterium]|nr:cytochrome c-type biogenesis protein CcmH [Chloroflexota bacterium]
MSVRRLALRGSADALLLGAVFLVVVAALLAALDLRPPSPAERASGLEAGLRCPVCQGLSIADSPAALAGEMRSVVVQKVAAGATDAAVRAFFIERYGQWILLAPDASGPNLLLWAAPGLLLIGGTAVVVGRSRRRGRRLRVEPADRVTADRPRPLVLGAAMAIVIAAVAVPLAVATGPRAIGGQITGGQATIQAAPPIEDLQARVTADPTDVGAFVALGDAYAGAGRGGDAADAYGRALKIEPNDVGALVGMSSLLLGAGRPDGALPLLDRAVAIAPDLPDAYLYRAIARYQLAGSPTAAARADALRFLDLAPADPRRTLADQLLVGPGPSGAP